MPAVALLIAHECNPGVFRPSCVRSNWSVLLVSLIISASRVHPRLKLVENYALKILFLK